jgi:hypothetical protein
MLLLYEYEIRIISLLFATDDVDTYFNYGTYKYLELVKARN